MTFKKRAAAVAVAGLMMTGAGVMSSSLTDAAHAQHAVVHVSGTSADKFPTRAKARAAAEARAAYYRRKHNDAVTHYTVYRSGATSYFFEYYAEWRAPVD